MFEQKDCVIRAEHFTPPKSSQLGDRLFTYMSMLSGKVQMKDLLETANRLWYGKVDVISEKELHVTARVRRDRDEDWDTQ